MNEFLRRMLFLPEQASTVARRIDSLHYFVIITTLLMSTAVGLTALFFFVRFRRRSESQTTPMIQAPLWLEALFVLVPLGFFLAWFARGYQDYIFIRTPPAGSIDVYVMAKQWMWKFAYPDGPNSLSVLRVPANRPVRLLMTSQDVIHSFYVPAFRIKQDVVPGRYTTAWFRPTRPGTYHLFCAEYCGTQHSGMIGQVVVLEPSQYEAWLSGGGTTGSLASTGQALFQQLGCSTCHRSDTQGRGPNLAGTFGKPVLLDDGQTVIEDENYIRESILNPSAKIVSGFKPIMPPFQGIVSEEQLNALVAYIKSLNQNPSGAAGSPTLLPAGTQPQAPKVQ